MLSSPRAGWTEVTVFGKTYGEASYIDDVPIMTLNAFINYFSSFSNGYGAFSLSYDAESYSFGLVEWNGELYAVNNTGDTEPYLCIEKIKDPENPHVGARPILMKLADELLEDISENIDAWTYWDELGIESLAEAKERRLLLWDKINVLQGLLQKHRNPMHTREILGVF